MNFAPQEIKKLASRVNEELSDLILDQLEEAGIEINAWHESIAEEFCSLTTPLLAIRDGEAWRVACSSEKVQEYAAALNVICHGFKPEGAKTFMNHLAENMSRYAFASGYLAGLRDYEYRAYSEKKQRELANAGV